MKKNKLITAALIFAFSATLTTGYAASDDGWVKPAGSRIDTVLLERHDYKQVQYLKGKLEMAVYAMSFDISGTVSEVFVKPGDRVEKYDTLIVLDETEKEQALDKYIEQLDINAKKIAIKNCIFTFTTDQKRVELNNLTAIVASGGASAAQKMQKELLELEIERRDDLYEEMVDEEMEERNAIQAKYDEANGDITKNYLLSQTDGVVIDCGLKKGNSVDPWLNAVYVLDDTKKYISTKDIQLNDIKAAGYEAFYLYVGSEKYQIEYVSEPSLGFYDSSRSYFTVPDIEIGDEDLYIAAVSQVKKDVLTVPSGAVFKNGDQRYVYRVNGDKKEMVDILCSDDDTDEIIILGGDIREGDEIYVP